MHPGHRALISPIPSFSSLNVQNIRNSQIFLVGQIQMSRRFLISPLRCDRAAKAKLKNCQQAKEKTLIYFTYAPINIDFSSYSAHFFTTPHIILSVFCSHHHFIFFRVVLVPNSHFSTAIFISVMSWPSSCNSFMSLQNLYQALKTST